VAHAPAAFLLAEAGLLTGRSAIGGAFSPPRKSASIQHQSVASSSTDTHFSDLLTWAAGHLKENLSVEVLADRSGMSVRSFTRKFRAAVGLPPAAAIEKMRFEEASGSCPGEIYR